MSIRCDSGKTNSGKKRREGDRIPAGRLKLIAKVAMERVYLGYEFQGDVWKRKES